MITFMDICSTAMALLLSSNLSIDQAPAEAGADPQKKRRPRWATGAIYATTAGLFFGSHFLWFLISRSSWNFVYALILTIWQNFVEDGMSKYDLEKKLQRSENSEIGHLCAFYLTDWLTDSLTDWLISPDRKVPPHFRLLLLVRL